MESNKMLDLDTLWGLSWKQSKKYALYFIIMNVLVYLCTRLAGMIGDTSSLVLLFSNPSLFNNPELLQEQFLVTMVSMLPMILLSGVIGWLLTAYFNIAIYRLLIDGVRDQKLDLTDRIKNAYNGYITYIINVFLNGLVVSIGYVFCVLPGLWLTVRLLFVPIIAANRPELSLGDALKESWNLTRGHFWKLLGYGILACLVNIVGFMCCCVGVLFTSVITQFMLANLYYSLSGGFDAEPEPTEQEEQV